MELISPVSSFSPSSPSIQTSGFSSISKVSPSVLLIIIILAIIFFVSGLLHLLVRYLLRPSRRNADEVSDTVTALQGQLQQLFHLHDSGVDQSFIDTLPIFNYKAIIGLKSPFDCAVCLSEFEAEDKLRLLPKCSHAFHMDCIDTWLLSHSTCPLCRANLIPDFGSSSRHCSPVVLVLESGSESSREIVPDPVARVESCDFRMANSGGLRKSCEIQVKEDGNDGKVMAVKLGKYRNVDHNGGEPSSSTSTKNMDSRRCFSMGSFAYVMDEDSSLQVPIRTPMKKPFSGKKPGHRLAMSECGGGDESRRDFVGFEAFRNGEILENNVVGNKAIGKVSKKESFSFSKIWQRGKREEVPICSSRRAFSFRFPVQNSNTNNISVANKGDKNGGRRTISEIDVGRWENCDLDSQSICSLDSQANHPSFARKTLLWLMGRQQNKVVHSQFSSQLV